MGRKALQTDFIQHPPNRLGIPAEKPGKFHRIIAQSLYLFQRAPEILRHFLPGRIQLIADQNFFHLNCLLTIEINKRLYFHPLPYHILPHPASENTIYAKNLQSNGEYDTLTIIMIPMERREDMKQMMRKKPLMFSLICIGAYVVIFGIAQSLPAPAALENAWELAVGQLLSCMLFPLLSLTDQRSFYGVCPPAVPAKKMLFYLPLAALISINFWCGAEGISGSGDLRFLFSMLFVALLEEVLFRGLLFRALLKEGRRQAILIASLTFGLGHLVNLLSGSDLMAGLLQAAYSMAAGYLLVMLFLKSGSLLPGILTHWLLNGLQIFTPDTLSTVQVLVPGSGILVISLAYGLYLRRLPDVLQQ
ncbi:MAG: CPBP family intramembrane metalloprotease [Clostridiales bacterium]|nr:CPBP family intramembrane metalloprotease [Clostridiales bacterium]